MFSILLIELLIVVFAQPAFGGGLGDTGSCEIIVNQGLGYGLNKSNGSMEPMQKFVAERMTGIFIPASKEEYEAYQNADHKLTVTGNGETWFLHAGGYEEEAGLVDFTSEDLEWKAGIYHLKTDIGNGQIERTIKVRDMKDIHVLIVPMKSCYSGTVFDAVEISDTLDDFSRKVFPLGKNDLDWSCYPHVLNLSGKSYDLDTYIGRFRVWRSLSNLQEKENTYDLIVGLLPKNMAVDKTERISKGNGSISGFTYCDPALLVSVQGSSPAVTIAHEIGHCYELGDEYPFGMVNLNKNMIPYKMSGTNMKNVMENVTGSCIYVKGGAGDDHQGAGTVVTSEQLPFDIETGELIQRTMTSYMGLADYDETEYWMTTDTWNSVYDALVLDE